MSSISPTNHSLSLFDSKIDQETIDTVLKDTFATYASEHSALVADTSTKLKENPDFYNNIPETGVPFRKLSNGYILITEPYIHDRSGEERYYLDLSYKIADLTNNSPLKNLVLTLNKMICEQKFVCDKVEIRLEKGSFDSHAQVWHLDSWAFEHSITICWSNKVSWNTKILDLENTLEFINYSPYWDEQNKTLKKIEAVAQTAKFGHFYNAKQILHRSPTLNDFKEEAIGVNDYRLFLRFTKDRASL
jgi:hypothetical protein